MISFSSSGDFQKTEKFLKALSSGDIFKVLDGYGQAGVSALRAATPSQSGATSAMWSYKVEKSRGSYSISWTNSNMAGGVPLVILLQYGHGTGTGGYVAGRDFINPAMKPIFDKIADGVWKAVKAA